MNSDGITRLALMRNLYQSKEVGSNSQMVRELQQIKNELKISNDEKIRSEAPITSATGSPYLTDQMYFKKEVIFGSDKETEWREVKSAEQVQKEAELVESNRKKLNII